METCRLPLCDSDISTLLTHYNGIDTLYRPSKARRVADRTDRRQTNSRSIMQVTQVADWSTRRRQFFFKSRTLHYIFTLNLILSKVNKQCNRLWFLWFASALRHA